MSNTGLTIERTVARVEEDGSRIFVHIPGASSRTFVSPTAPDEMVLELGQAMSKVQIPEPLHVLRWLREHGAIETNRARWAYVDVPYTDDDGIPESFPGREGSDAKGVIVFKLDLLTGKIAGWPKGRREGLLLEVGAYGAVTVSDSDEAVLREHHGWLPDWLPMTGGTFMADIRGDGAISVANSKIWKPNLDDIADWIAEDAEYAE